MLVYYYFSESTREEVNLNGSIQDIWTKEKKLKTALNNHVQNIEANITEYIMLNI